MKHLFILFLLTDCIHSVHAQNVGIGTQTPAYPLTVYSNATGIVQEGPNVKVGMAVSAFAGYIRTFTNHALHFSTNNGPTQMALVPTGQLGFGTALPSAKLHAVGSMNDMLMLENSTALASGITNRIIFKTGLYYTGMITTHGQGSDAAKMAFYTQATSSSPSNLAERMTILNNGYVGINNSAPQYRLDINGATRVSDQLTVEDGMVLSGPLRRPASGGNPATADMNWLPIAIGKIKGDIAISGTGNLTSQVVSAGKVKISIAGEQLFGNENKYTILVTPSGGGAIMASATITSDNKIEVTMTKPAVHYWNNSCSCEMFSTITDGQFYDYQTSEFSILVYKWDW